MIRQHAVVSTRPPDGLKAWIKPQRQILASSQSVGRVHTCGSGSDGDRDAQARGPCGPFLGT